MIFTCRKQLLYNFLLYSICVASTWVFLKIVLGTDKGLDLTDEGLYLLAADPPTKNATWGFPFGWHTKPLFRLVNYDICSFRTLGAFLLFLAGGWLGNSLIATFTNREKISEGKLKFLKISGWIIGASGTLFYYGSLLTTPSYNWINLIGIYISAIGLFNILQLNEQKNKNDKLKKWKWIYLTAAGLFLTIPAKPTTVIFIVFLAF